MFLGRPPPSASCVTGQPEDDEIDGDSVAVSQLCRIPQAMNGVKFAKKRSPLGHTDSSKIPTIKQHSSTGIDDDVPKRGRSSSAQILFKSFFMLYTLCLSFGSNFSAAATLVGYTEKQVWDYIREMPRQNVSEKCGQSLDLVGVCDQRASSGVGSNITVEVYLKDRMTLALQRDLYYQSFSSGDATQFISRDQDRWLYNAFKCIKAAGETSYSASEYPMHYCYGYNEKDPQIAYGVCIPSPCAGDRKSLVKEWQAVVSKDKDHQRLDYEDCTNSRHQKQWYELTVPLIHFGSDIVLVLIVGFATIYQLKRGDSTKSLPAQLLLSFSMIKNIRKLIQMPKDPQSTITCMFGLRFLSMVWTLVGHSFIFVQAFLDNVDEFKDDLVDNFWNQWITNFTLSVDVFLTLSGCLTAYSWFRKWQKKNAEDEPTWRSWKYWLQFYRHRVVRLWPAYIYTLVAVTTRVSITHYHPMWPPTDPAVQCPKHWMENVFFINSLTDNRCMPWTWYIGTEFIFYLLSPIFLLSLRRSPILGLSISVAIIVASAVANVITTMEHNFPPTQMLWKQPAIFSPDFIKHHLLIYIKPWYRIGPYIVGILLGYFLANSQMRLAAKKDAIASGGDPRGRSVKFIVIGWILSLITLFWSIFGLYPSLQGWDWPIYHYFYGATSRTIFSLSLGWIIYACHTGIGGPLNYMLSLSPLLPLSILSYSVYLIHMIPVVFTYLIVDFPIHYIGKRDIFIHCSIQLAISYCFGMLCTMVAELPALNIEHLFLNRVDHRHRQQGADCTKSALKPLHAADCEVQLKMPPPEEPDMSSTSSSSDNESKS